MQAITSFRQADLAHCSTAGAAKNRTRIGSVVLPQFSPMRLGIRREPFDHPDWLYELKYDGFRALAFIESGSCRLVSRKAHVYQSSPACARH